MILKKEYKKRQAQLFAKMKKESGIIVLVSPKQAHKRGDQTFDFVQNNNILYLTGVNLQNTAVLFNIKQQKVILFTSKPNINTEIWEGPQESFAKLHSRYAVDEVKDIAELDAYLKKYKIIHSLKHCSPKKTYTDTQLKKVLLGMRIIKSKSEIACIKKASKYTNTMYEIATTEIRHKKSPLQIKAALDFYLTSQQLTHAFSPIITTKGNVLHNELYETQFKPNMLLLLDMGCEFAHYASDFTRTFPTTKSTKKQATIQSIVSKVKEQTIHSIKPGQTLLEVHQFATNALIDELINIGLLIGKKEDIVKSGAIKVFFPHGIGHHLGLDTHDLTDLVDIQNQKPIAINENMVITVEPGIYFIDTYVNNLPQFRKYFKHINYRLLKQYAKEVSGVREEDTVLITKSGAKKFVSF